MKKDTIWIAVGTLLSIGIGYYAYKRFFKTNVIKVPDGSTNTRDILNTETTQPQQPDNVITGTIGAIVNPVVNAATNAFSFLTSWNDYTVNTASTSLNVRQMPNTTSRVIASLPKGATVKAKASGIKDWLAVSKDGKNTYGYVSAQYMKAKI